MQNTNTTLPFTMPVKRGCGVRIEGGLYIVTDAEIEDLVDYVDLSDANVEGKLYIFPKPYPALVPLKPFRGFRGFDKETFLSDLRIEAGLLPDDGVWTRRPRLKNCYYAHPEDSRSWLHWVGNQYYSIKQFIQEARQIGVSRRVPATMLKKMKWGDTIFLASKEQNLKSPVVFGYFKLERIQGVKVDIDELPEHLRSKTRFSTEEW